MRHRFGQVINGFFTQRLKTVEGSEEEILVEATLAIRRYPVRKCGVFDFIQKANLVAEAQNIILADDDFVVRQSLVFLRPSLAIRHQRHSFSAPQMYAGGDAEVKQKPLHTFKQRGIRGVQANAYAFLRVFARHCAVSAK